MRSEREIFEILDHDCPDSTHSQGDKQQTPHLSCKNDYRVDG